MEGVETAARGFEALPSRLNVRFKNLVVESQSEANGSNGPFVSEAPEFLVAVQ